MSSSINASLTTGINITSDTSGILNLQSNGTTVASVSSTGVAVTGTLSSTGNTTLGDASTDTLNVASGTLVTDGLGKVGIGTASPSTKLHVYTGSATGTYTRVENTAGILYLGTKSGGEGYVATESNTALTFATNGTERMRIDASGNLLMYTTNASDAAGNGVKILPITDKPEIACVGNSAAAGFISYSMYSSSASAYKFYVSYDGVVHATTTTISAISDQRLKENIVDLDVGLDAILALKPRKFDWKEGKGKDIKGDRGFIAQEFETIFPDLIDEWRDPAPEGDEPYKSVRAELIPVLVKAIQEQQALITSLTARLEVLENK